MPVTDRRVTVQRDDAILVHKLNKIMNGTRKVQEPRTVNLGGTAKKFAASKIGRENNVRGAGDLHSLAEHDRTPAHRPCTGESLR